MDNINQQKEREARQIFKYVDEIKSVLVKATRETNDNGISLFTVMLIVVSDFITSYAIATNLLKADVFREFYKRVFEMVYKNKNAN